MDLSCLMQINEKKNIYIYIAERVWKIKMNCYVKCCVN